MNLLCFALLTFSVNLQTLTVSMVAASAAASPDGPKAGAPAGAPVVQKAPGRETSPVGPVFEQEVGLGKTSFIDMPVPIKRVAVSNPDCIEALPVSPQEVMINGRKVGVSSLVLWLNDGNRLVYSVTVAQDHKRLDAVQRELTELLPTEDVKVSFDNDTVFLRGTVSDLITADRAIQIAKTMGPVINLLNVSAPPVRRQILLKVRFADVDRATEQDLGFNLFSTGATNTLGTISTGQYTPPTVTVPSPGSPASATLSDALNLFIFRPSLNLGATIEALESKNLLEMLAEPNVLAIDGKPASFLSGGEFPFPTLQGGGAGLGAVTIAFREFGVRINFLPTITDRGNIRLELTPEVSSLDFANGLTYDGFTIPALSTRRVQTEVELQDGQSFAIAGLLNNQVTETLNKIPGLGDIPLFGKLFQSRQRQKKNSELLIIITPEIVNPVPAGTKVPIMDMPQPWIQGTAATSPRTPGMDKTGDSIVQSRIVVPYERLSRQEKDAKIPPPTNAQPTLQFVPMLVPSQQQSAPAAPSAAPASQTSAAPASGAASGSGAN
jgi:pilus assembly protein CpaC